MKLLLDNYVSFVEEDSFDFNFLFNFGLKCKI